MTSPQTTLPFPPGDITVHAGVYFHGLAWAVAMLHARDRARRSGDGVRLRALAWHVAALHGAALTLCAMVADDCAAMAATEGV